VPRIVDDSDGDQPLNIAEDRLQGFSSVTWAVTIAVGVR
jgi:hypothetical protein